MSDSGEPKGTKKGGFVARIGTDQWLGITFIGVSLILNFVLIPYSIPVVRGFGSSTRLFPRIFSILIGVVGTSLLFSRSRTDASERPSLEKSQLARVFVTTSLTLGYILLIRTIGFVVATTFFLFIVILFFGERRWYLCLATSVVTSLVIKYILALPLGISLPTGLFF
jgi:hypothetical protein